MASPKLYKEIVAPPDKYPYVDNKVIYLAEKAGMDFVSFERETYEKVLVASYLNPKARVLELGGGNGLVSEVIKSKIKNKRNHVIIEPHPQKAKKLLNQGFQVFNGIISNEGKYFCDNYTTKTTSPASNTKSQLLGSDKITNIYTLEKKYDIEFDTLIADCEGSLPQDNC